MKFDDGWVQFENNSLEDELLDVFAGLVLFQNRISSFKGTECILCSASKVGSYANNAASICMSVTPGIGPERLNAVFNRKSAS